MNCPVCDSKLRTVEKYNIELDICPDCKGIWLDRGEIEKIIEMSAKNEPINMNNQYRSTIHEDEHRDRHDDHQHKDHEQDQEYGHQPVHKKRRSSWLSDVLGSFGGED